MSRPKFLFPLVFIVLLCSVPIYFILTYDFSKLKTRAEKLIEQKTGSPFTAGAMHLGLRGGLSLELKDVRFQGARGVSAPLATAESIAVHVKLRPLLSKRLEVTDIVLVRPRVALRRDSSGAWNLPEMSKGGSEGAVYLVSRIRIEDGEISWSDAANPASAGVIKQLDAQIADISPVTAITVSIRAALPDSDGRNLEWEGRIGPFSGLVEPVVDGSFKIRLDDIDWAAFRRRFPRVSDFPISGDRLRGRLEGTIRGPLDWKKLEGEGQLALEKIESPILGAPIVDWRSSWFYRDNSVGLKDVTARWGPNGTFEGDVRVDTPFEIPSAHARVALRDVEAHDIAPRRPRRWDVYGKVNADGEFHFDPRGTAAVLASLGGKGQFELTGGTLTNMNVLSLVVQKVSNFVGFDIRANIHPAFQPLLRHKDMALTLVQSRFSIEGGNAKVNEVSIVSNEFDVRGGGNISLLGRIHLNCGLFISPALSAEIIRSVPDLAAVVDPGGRLLFPFTVAGAVRHPSIVVDKDYLTARVVAVKGQQIIQNVLSKGAGTASDAGSTTGNLLNNFF